MKYLSFFPTFVYQAPLLDSNRISQQRSLIREILREASIVRKIDEVGVEWSAKNYADGFTSYGSMDKLHQTSPTFAELEGAIDRHVRHFARKQNWDLGGGTLKMSSCWVNMMPAGAHHGMHLHTLSVVSGSFYVALPKGSSPIKFEDPRLDKFMAQPPRRAGSEYQPFQELEPRVGEVILFESWLRHEVPRLGKAVKEARVSVSFNYDWV